MISIIPLKFLKLKELDILIIIDLRPRVNDYSVTQGSRSPFEFLGRSFLNGNHSSADVVADGESILLDYSYYLPRIDRIFLTKDGFHKKMEHLLIFHLHQENSSGALKHCQYYITSISLYN